MLPHSSADRSSTALVAVRWPITAVGAWPMIPGCRWRARAHSPARLPASRICRVSTNSGTYLSSFTLNGSARRAAWAWGMRGPREGHLKSRGSGKSKLAPCDGCTRPIRAQTVQGRKHFSRLSRPSASNRNFRPLCWLSASIAAEQSTHLGSPFSIRQHARGQESAELDETSRIRAERLRGGQDRRLVAS